VKKTADCPSYPRRASKAGARLAWGMFGRWIRSGRALEASSARHFCDGVKGDHMQAIDLRRVKHLLLVSGVTLAAFVLSFSVPSASGAASATESVKRTIDQVLHILQDKEMKKPDRTDERRKLIEKTIGDRFGWEEMAKRTLGSQWAKMNEKQRQEFVDLFRTLLTNTYIGRIETYSGEQIQYINERLQDGFAEVRTKVSSGKTEFPMDYRLLNKSGDWHVYDIVLDGVSLVANYRGQFNKILHSSGYDDLVEKLRTKSEKITPP
jgi:phospholipid transport system substrate-binding protein